MLRHTFPRLAANQQHREGPANLHRVHRRRMQLERRRILESALSTPPVEPTGHQAVSLYRALLKAGQVHLQLTDKEYFRTKLRYEFEVTARQTSARVRGMMFEKGQWMLKNKLGGLV